MNAEEHVQRTKEILEQIAMLPLDKYPHNEAVQLIRELEKYGCMAVNLHPGKIVMRARPHSGNEEFTKKGQLSYKPQEYNKTYQRASTPNRTMFYATAVPENLQPGELDNLRVIGVFESLPWMRDKTQKGYKKISFGKWVVTKDIKLLAVIHHKDFYERSSYTKELVEAFQAFIKDYPEYEQKTNIISDFFANEFAKEEINHDYDYLLSAVFSEMAVDLGFDGVFYPSVRTQGQGFNVAIRPEVADSSLELVVAGECSLYKFKEKSVVDNDKITEVEKGHDEFKMKLVEKPHYAGPEECLKELGLKSLDELQ